jgi:hypothetical protein
MIRGRRSAAAAFALLISVAPAALWAQGATIQQQFLIYAGPLHRDYLGCLNCDQFDPNSVWDGYSAMGWGNAFAADPPILIDRSLNHYGVLSVSTKRADSVCGPKGVKSICEALKRTCNNGEEPLR